MGLVPKNIPLKLFFDIVFRSLAYHARCEDVVLEDINEGKAACAIHVTKLRAPQNRLYLDPTGISGAWLVMCS